MHSTITSLKEIWEDLRLMNYQLQDEGALLTSERLLALQAGIAEKEGVAEDTQHAISRYEQNELRLKEQLSALQIEKNSLDLQLALTRKELTRIQVEFTDISEENQWLQEKAKNLEEAEAVQLREKVYCTSSKIRK